VGMGMVSHRICTNNFNCVTCEFDQEMQDKLARGETTEAGTSDVDAAMEKLLSLPGNKRLCRYALKGDVSFRLCSRLYACETCEFGQMMEDIQQQKLEQRAVALAARKKVLVSYYIDPEKCQGCMICLKNARWRLSPVVKRRFMLLTRRNAPSAGHVLKFAHRALEPLRC